MSQPPEFVVYTDGASRKDGRGGWGWFLRTDDGFECQMCGGEYNTTNNRMEIMGAIKAIQEIACHVEPGERAQIELWSDSQYLVMGITEHIHDWLFRGWRTSTNKPVKNADLWKVVHELDQAHDVVWKWVKGHSGNDGNEKADTLATLGVPPPREPKTNAPTTRVPLRRRTVR